MAILVHYFTIIYQYFISWFQYVPDHRKKPGALRVGVLSTAFINAASIIHPVETHDDVILYAIASRDSATASNYARRYKFRKSYGSYEALLADPLVDFVYISLPNSLHFEWALKALQAGKHVLLETPFSSTSIEAAKLALTAKECGKTLMEASHWQFHPVAHRFKELLDREELGAIVKTNATVSSIPGVPSSNFRWQYNLSGGSLMDMSFVISFTCYLLQAKLHEEVVYAKATSSGSDPRIDVDMTAILRYERAGLDTPNVYSTIHSNLLPTWQYGVIPRFWDLPSITVETENGVFVLYNALTPHLYHSLGIKHKSTGEWKYEKLYSGGPLWKGRGSKYWSTYRYQLEAFVDKLRGRKPVCWIDNEFSLQLMKTIDEVYKKSGLPVRSTNLLALVHSNG